jgi:hypothetical protein
MTAAARSWDKVAAAVGIDVRKLHRLREEQGAPKTKDPKAWRAFIAKRDAERAAAREKPQSATEVAREAADLEYAQARARREKRSDELEAGRLVTKDQAVEVASAVRDAFIVEGEALPAAVLALVPTLGKSEKLLVEDAVRAAWRQARERIAKGSAKGARHG